MSSTQLKESIHISSLATLLDVINTYQVDLHNLVLSQVVDANGKVFNVGLDFNVLKSGLPYFQMTHPDLGIYSIKNEAPSLPDNMVALPKSVEQAKAMMRIASMYLEQHK